MYPYCHYPCWSCNTSVSICTYIPIIDVLLRTLRNKIYFNFFFIWKSEQRCYSFFEGCYIGNENKVSPICMSEFYWYSLLFSRSVDSDSLKPHRLPYARLPCLSPSPGVCSNSCPLILISLLIEIQLLKTNQLNEKLTQGSGEKGNSFLIPFLPVLGWKYLHPLAQMGGLYAGTKSDGKESFPHGSCPWSWCSLWSIQVKNIHP